MGMYTNFAAAAALTLAASAANAVTVTNPFSDSASGVSPDVSSVVETYELSFLTSFDIVFTVSTIASPTATYTYEIEDSSGVFASGTLTTAFASPFLTLLDGIESFYADEDFTVTLSTDGSETASMGWTIVSPSTTLPAVPVPAALPLLATGIAGLAIARRRA